MYLMDRHEPRTGQDSGSSAPAIDHYRIRFVLSPEADIEARDDSPADPATPPEEAMGNPLQHIGTDDLHRQGCGLSQGSW
jgi:hypothetical protein